MASCSASVVVTTHSMCEAEYLCQKIAMLVNGRVRTVGQLQHLKSLHGDGYTVTLLGSSSSLATRFLTTFPQSR